MKNNFSRNECGVSGPIKQLISFESSRISKENGLCKPKRTLCDNEAEWRHSTNNQMLEDDWRKDSCSIAIQKVFYLLKVKMVFY